jgi:hypothetical protein
MRIGAACALLLALGCSRSPSEQRASDQKKQQSIQSESRLLSRLLEEGRVPRLFAREHAVYLQQK